MPGKVRVKIIAGRNLPVMDRGSDTTDAFVEIKLANITYKTDVYRKSLNPQWNSDFYRFELDDAELQDEPLQIRLMDHDTYSANDAIGKVNISLNPLLLPSLDASGQVIRSGKGAVMSGWIPVFDTMHGIRGEVNLIVKVDLFSDVNKFRQSSCGVQFFHSACIPYGFHAQIIHGFVEELVVNDDPEYQWIDKIRTPRASNEARQTVFLRLSGQVQRKIGLKAIDLGANAVIGYSQSFDLEGDVGVVARGTGTAVTLIKIHEHFSQPTVDHALLEEQLKYLEFLTANDSRNCESKFDSTSFNSNPGDIVYKILGITPGTESRVMLNKKPKNNSRRDVIFEEDDNELEKHHHHHHHHHHGHHHSHHRDHHGHQHDTDTDLEKLKILLDQEDNRGQKSKNLLRKKMQHIGNTSKNMINKRLLNKSSRDDDNSREDEQTANLSNVSRFNSMTSLKSTVSADLRGILRKGKLSVSKHTPAAAVNPKFQRSTSDGAGMAALLIRSMLAAPSLDRINESHDITPATNVPAQPLSSIDKPHQHHLQTKSESLGNLRPKKHVKNQLQMKTALGQHDFKISDSNLSSNFSLSSCTLSSVSDILGEEEEEEEEESELDDSRKNDIVLVDADTVSMVVKSVLAQEESQNYQNEWIQPSNSSNNLANMVKSSTATTTTTTSSSSSNSFDSDEIGISSNLTTTGGVDDEQDKFIQDLIDDSCKMIRSGSSRVFKDSKGHYSDVHIVENARKPEELEKFLRRPNEDQDAECWIQPGSTTDEPECLEQTSHGSLFHDLKEKCTGKIHNLQEHLHYPYNHQDNHNKYRLLSAAMDTILAEQAEILGVPKDALKSSLQEDENLRRGSVDSLRKKMSDLYKKNHHVSDVLTGTTSTTSMTTTTAGSDKQKKSEIKHSESGMIGIAMKTMLMDAANLAEEVIVHPLNNPPAAIIFSSYSSDLNDLSPSELNNNESYGSDVEFGSEKLSPSKMFKSLNDLTDNLPDQKTPPPFFTANTPITDDNKIDNVKTNAISMPIDIIKGNSPIPPRISLTNSTPPTPISQYQPLTEIPKCNIIKNTPAPPSMDLISTNPLRLTSSSSATSSNITTNKAFLLAPTPFPIHRSEAAASTIPNAPPAVIDGGTPPAPSKTIGCHIRAESAGCKMSQSPSKSITHSMSNSQGGGTDGPTNSSTSTGTIPKEKDPICRRSSDSDLTVTPKGNSLSTTLEHRNQLPTAQQGGTPVTAISNQQQQLQQQQQVNVPATASFGRVITTTTTTSTTKVKAPLHEHLEMLEYPFLTMSKYPVGFIVHLGAAVCARSVKLLERVPNPDEPETRDSWWTELRMEIRSHARAIGCNIILGYSEVTSISDDVCVLSVTGTAAIINLLFTSGEIGLLNTALAPPAQSTTVNKIGVIKHQDPNDKETKHFKNSALPSSAPISMIPSGTVCAVTGLTEQDLENESKFGTSLPTTGNKENTPTVGHTTSFSSKQTLLDCALCHITYSRTSEPFSGHMKKCAVCKQGYVPDVLLGTIEIPEALQITGRGCFLQAQVCRTKKDLKTESNAKEISDALPFLEYDLHKLLINKLKTKGMNAIFGLKVTVTIGEKIIALIATGTAVFLTALPAPTVPKVIAGNSWTNSDKLSELQRSLKETVDRNREIYQLKSFSEFESNACDDPDESEDETVAAMTVALKEIDLSAGNKGTFVLEVDDIEDIEIISQLMEPCPPEGFHVVNTHSVPGLHDLEVIRNLQMFTQIWRAKLSLNQQGSNFSKHFQRLLQTIFFKLRTMIPCAICDLKFRLDLPDGEEIQLLVTGMALGLGEPSKLTKYKRKIAAPLLTKDARKLADDELIFSLEEEHVSDLSQTQSLTFPVSGGHHQFAQTGSLKLKNKSPNRTAAGLDTTSTTTTGGGASNTVSSGGGGGSSGGSGAPRFNSLPIRERYGVDITPLSYVPGGKIEKYLGNLNFFFIRECTSIRENGGISGFVHSFITEMLAVVRAHVTALGGNALVSFYMTELILVDNPHKNQGQCLISVGGDVVHVTYYSDE